MRFLRYIRIVYTLHSVIFAIKVFVFVKDLDDLFSAIPTAKDTQRYYALVARVV